MEEIFLKTVDKLNRKTQHVKKSEYKKLMMDCEFFENLMYDLEFDNYKLYGLNRFKYDDDTFMDYFDVFFEPILTLTDEAIEVFKNNKYYYYYGKENYDKIANKNEIICNFLEYFMPEVIDIYYDMVKKGHVLLADLGGYFIGSAYPLIETNENYLIIDSNLREHDYTYIETIIHELMHIYSSVFLKKYNKLGNEELNNGLLGETVSMYSELSLYEFLKKEKLLGNNIEFAKNIGLNTNLSHYKSIKYLMEAIKKDLDIEISGIYYNISGDLELDGEYPFEYNIAKLKEGYLNDILYAIGNYYAYHLLDKELNGENVPKLIKDFLISLQDVSCYDLLTNKKHDFSLMEKDIKDNQEKIKKMYKII